MATYVQGDLSMLSFARGLLTLVAGFCLGVLATFAYVSDAPQQKQSAEVVQKQNVPLAPPASLAPVAPMPIPAVRTPTQVQPPSSQGSYPCEDMAGLGEVCGTPANLAEIRRLLP